MQYQYFTHTNATFHYEGCCKDPREFKEPWRWTRGFEMGQGDRKLWRKRSILGECFLRISISNLTLILEVVISWLWCFCFTDFGVALAHLRFESYGGKRGLQCLAFSMILQIMLLFLTFMLPILVSVVNLMLLVMASFSVWDLGLCVSHSIVILKTNFWIEVLVMVNRVAFSYCMDRCERCWILLAVSLHVFVSLSLIVTFKG